MIFNDWLFSSYEIIYLIINVLTGVMEFFRLPPHHKQQRFYKLWVKRKMYWIFNYKIFLKFFPLFLKNKIWSQIRWPSGMEFDESHIMKKSGKPKFLNIFYIRKILFSLNNFFVLFRLKCNFVKILFSNIFLYLPSFFTQKLKIKS